MFSHIFIGVSDFPRALAFYRALMPVLGVQERFCEPGRPWAGWQSSPDPRPLLLIGTPFDGQPHTPGNGAMTAFMASSRAMVDLAHAAAPRRLVVAGPGVDAVLHQTMMADGHPR